MQNMPDFLMNIVSPEDQWTYITSRGAITAGRKDANQALFPYYTQDKLIDLTDTTGSFTSIRVEHSPGVGSQNWRPFSKNRPEFPYIERNLYKSPEGNEVIFEETNKSLGLNFSYLWTFSPRFGFVRFAQLSSSAQVTLKVSLLDGLQNLVPYGLNQDFMSRFSNLSDAYKKSELLVQESLGIYYLSSIPTDRAEPSEGLRATIAWSINYQPDHVLLSSNQLKNFEDHKALSTETDIRGQRCSYLLHKELELEPGEQFQGWIVADINQDAGNIEELRTQTKDSAQLTSRLKDDIEKGSKNIRKKITSADGYQLSNDSQRCSRHLSNVLFNIMRGGIFSKDYEIPLGDFRLHLEQANKSVFSKFEEAIKKLPETLSLSDFLAEIQKHSDLDLLRIATEYLPLTFSRRHGDPSRPWNAFSIETTDSEGNPKLAYQGNWRDIFQNWETLAYSFPNFLTGTIFRLRNASTIDGYNPYRLTKEGFDWEIPEPSEPWSNIGYWGDHQIVYLLKFLEMSARLDPDNLSALLDKPWFVCADVPYRIASFKDIWQNPQETVEFDYACQEAIDHRVSKIGGDGKLLTTADGDILKLSLLEKLLIPLLSKLSNFVPEGGIWMNTQRPEWNDANNALVGNGLSVVTLGYINRYIDFLINFLESKSEPEDFTAQKSIADFFHTISQILSKHADKLTGPLNKKVRYQITEALGNAGSEFRNVSYSKISLKTSARLNFKQVILFLKNAQLWVKHSLDSNRREDDLYHSYNLLKRGSREIAIERLYEMLEGQVSILSSNYLNAKDSLTLLNALRNSAIYREDRNTYLLYPDRELPTFLEKNNVDKTKGADSQVIQHLLESGDRRIVYGDAKGAIRFNGDFKNAGDLKRQLLSMKDDMLPTVAEDELEKVVTLFEDTFRHHAFTGRSGTFFAYEGLGSIYWHMVSKLLLAIQENYHQATLRGSDPSVLEGLASHYFETLEGLGLYDLPQKYGAFPSDAYSHTPKHAGAQQPGMTGQVKEDILIRQGELGICIERGILSFKPLLLRSKEFLQQPSRFPFVGLNGEEEKIELEKNELAFTFCQVPVVYQKAEVSGLEILLTDDSRISSESNSLNKELSRSLFSREGKLSLIRVKIPIKSLQS
jgi:hypothetical protein